MNLSGAFAGYFLLVLISFGFTLKLMTDDVGKELENAKAQNISLQEQNKNLQSLYQLWTIEGQITGSFPEKTKLFVDAKNTHFASTGDFSTSIYLRNDTNNIYYPTALCFFNSEDGYKVINLNKKTSKNFDLFGITILDDKHLITESNPF